MHDQQRERNPIELWRAYFLREAASVLSRLTLKILEGHYRMTPIVYRNTLSLFLSFRKVRGHLQRCPLVKRGVDLMDLTREISSPSVLFFCIAL